MINPFGIIVPLKDDELVNEEVIKDLASRIKNRINDRRLIIITGDYGSGKSLYLKRLFDRLRTSKEWLNFNKDLINILKTIIVSKNKSVFIDDFDLINGLTDEELFDLTNALLELVNNGLIIITACLPVNFKKLLRVNPLLQSKTQRLRVKPLSFSETKALVINRLNSVRRRKSNSLEPFSVDELRSIWSKTNGNPRMILLILKELFRLRVLFNES